MNDQPVLTARQASAKWWQEITAAYPHYFTFVEAWNGRGTTDEQFDAMHEWVQAHAGVRDKDWRTSGSPMGGDITYWFKDPETAMLFKLTFVGSNG